MASGHSPACYTSWRDRIQEYAGTDYLYFDLLGRPLHLGRRMRRLAPGAHAGAERHSGAYALRCGRGAASASAGPAILLCPRRSARAGGRGHPTSSRGRHGSGDHAGSRTPGGESQHGRRHVSGRVATTQPWRSGTRTGESLRKRLARLPHAGPPFACLARSRSGTYHNCGFLPPAGRVAGGVSSEGAAAGAVALNAARAIYEELELRDPEGRPLPAVVDCVFGGRTVDELFTVAASVDDALSAVPAELRMRPTQT